MSGGGLHRTVWYELQARDWPLKNQAAEALIWQIGSGEGMKRVLASVSLGKEVTVSSHPVLGEGGGAGGPVPGCPSFTHLRSGNVSRMHVRLASVLLARRAVSFPGGMVVKNPPANA